MAEQTSCGTNPEPKWCHCCLEYSILESCPSFELHRSQRRRICVHFFGQLSAPCECDLQQSVEVCRFVKIVKALATITMSSNDPALLRCCKCKDCFERFLVADMKPCGCQKGMEGTRNEDNRFRCHCRRLVQKQTIFTKKRGLKRKASGDETSQPKVIPKSIVRKGEVFLRRRRSRTATLVLQRSTTSPEARTHRRDWRRSFGDSAVHVGVHRWPKYDNENRRLKDSQLLCHRCPTDYDPLPNKPALKSKNISNSFMLLFSRFL